MLKDMLWISPKWALAVISIDFEEKKPAVNRTISLEPKPFQSLGVDCMWQNLDYSKFVKSLDLWGPENCVVLLTRPSGIWVS